MIKVSAKLNKSHITMENKLSQEVKVI